MIFVKQMIETMYNRKEGGHFRSCVFRNNIRR